MNQTSKYKLNQWDKEDRILREDFNGDNGKVEAALAGLAERTGALEGAVALRGNCEVYTTSYTGTGGFGESGACRLTFPKPPLLVVVSGYDCYGICMRGSKMHTTHTSVMVHCITNWSSDGKTLSWYDDSPGDQMNSSGAAYCVTALMAADA